MEHISYIGASPQRRNGPSDGDMEQELISSPNLNFLVGFFHVCFDFIF